MTNPFSDPLQAVYYIGSILGYTFLIGRWLLKRHDDAKKSKDFILELKSNHLPHLYAEAHWTSKAIRAICNHLGITLEEPPYPEA